MFTEGLTDDDARFFSRLDHRAGAALAPADPSRDRLRAAIAGLRGVLDPQPASDDALTHVHDLLDSVWWATSGHDPQRARAAAGALSHAVRDLRLDGARAMRAVSAVLEIRSLVVLAA